MKKQHKIWLDDDSPTDVLTFNLADPPRSRIIDAQILICPAIARARARLARTSWVSETLLYIIHGCLHLCGYNDAARKDFARIHDMEDRILLDLGRGPVFNPDPSTRPPARRRPRKSGTSKTPR